MKHLLHLIVPMVAAVTALTIAAGKADDGNNLQKATNVKKNRPKKRLGAIWPMALGGIILISSGFALFKMRQPSASAAFAKPPCASCILTAKAQAQSPYPVCVQQVVQVQAGQALHLTASNPLPMDGNNYWSTDFGYISATGLYAAPTTVPDGGLDTIMYSNPNTGVSFSISVWIVPNSGAPVSQYAPTITPANPSPSVPPFTYTSSSNSNAPGLAGAGASSQPVSSEPGTPNPNEFSTPAAISPTVINGVNEFPMPVVAEGQGTLPGTIYASVDGIQPLNQACRGPLYGPPSWVGTACTGGTRLVTGPISYSQTAKGTYNSSLYISAQLQGEILGWGGNVTVGTTLPVSYDWVKIHAWQNADVYHCVNGEWTFWYSEHCDQYNTEDFNFTPSWYYHILGFSSDPHWGTWQPPTGMDCHAI